MWYAREKKIYGFSKHVHAGAVVRQGGGGDATNKAIPDLSKCWKLKSGYICLGVMLMTWPKI